MIGTNKIGNLLFVSEPVPVYLGINGSRIMEPGFVESSK